ncbi:MAG: AzlC family ABC transporter permease [Neorhizobium sp.]|nr:AzlC family ABC transporter permease [Neorhizobium sp.]
MTTRDFQSGIRSGAVAALSSAPFGVLFGALAIDQGLSPFEAVLMSASIYAGASQIVGIELFGQSVPAWLVILSVFAVNFRHILYSAALTPAIAHFTGAQKALAFFLLVDPQFAEATKRVDRGEPVTIGWWLSMAVVVYTSWIASTAIGAVFGGLIGDTHALGFDVLPAIYFLGMLTGFHKRPNFYPIVIASAVVSIAAFHTIGSPWHVSAGAAAGVLVAALMAPAGPRQKGKNHDGKSAAAASTAHSAGQEA